MAKLQNYQSLNEDNSAKKNKEKRLLAQRSQYADKVATFLGKNNQRMPPELPQAFNHIA